MVRHQAIRVQSAARPGKQAAKMKEIEAPVLVGEEAGLAIVTALHDMNRQAMQHEACTPRHGTVNACC